MMILTDIYDSLGATDPVADTQYVDWTTINHRSLHNGELGYTPPSGTVLTCRFPLRNDLYFQDGKQVTAFDVAFSYLSLRANGAFQSTGASAMSGITIVSPSLIDINVNADSGIFSLISLASLTILPGRYWSQVGKLSWDNAVTSCIQTGQSCYQYAQYAQYALQPAQSPGQPLQVACALQCSFSSENMKANPNQVRPTDDPLSSGWLIGSGPWECISSSGLLGRDCSSDGTMNPISGGYVLTRFGKGIEPGAGLNDHYFRSNGNLAIWIWSGNNGDFTHDFINYSAGRACNGQPVGTSSCIHWQEGIVGRGDGVTCCVVGSVQISAVGRFLAINWVAPFGWNTFPPTGLAALSPVLYEGSAPTLNPASVVGCTAFYPTGGYGC